MKAVTAKTKTLRRAVASGRVVADPRAIKRLAANDVPKPDILVTARVAAVAAAKRTADLIPHCHPLPIDAVDVDFELHEGHIGITASVEAIWKTGVEMEALTAVSVAALTICDMLKPIDKKLSIESVKLDEKRGGKTDYRKHAPKSFKAAVIVISDSTYAGTRTDRSGRIICERLAGHGIEPLYDVLPDERERIVTRLRELVETGTDLVLTTGGTGLGPRDVTVEATRKVIEQEVPGIMEAARGYGQDRTPYAMLSRGCAGICGRTLIINLPGSSSGAEDTMNAIFPAVLHAHGMLQGKGH